MSLKKVGTAGRFGSRYGRKVRKEVATIEKRQKAKHECPSCMKETLNRISSGVWECHACKNKFSGGAYFPSTGALKILKKSIASSESLEKEGV